MTDTVTLTPSGLDPVIIYPQLTRVGLNALINSPTDVKQAITHIGLSSTAFEPHYETTTIPDEIARWKVLDGFEATPTQVTVYAEFPWTGDDTPIRTLSFYIGDVLLAAYSTNSEEVEAFLTKRVLLDGWYHLAFEAAPIKKITVINSGYKFTQEYIDLKKEIQQIKRVLNDLLCRGIAVPNIDETCDKLFIDVPNETLHS